MCTKIIAEFKANKVLSLGEKTLNFTAAYICNTTCSIYKSFRHVSAIPINHIIKRADIGYV